MSDQKMLPSASVPEQGYELIRDFAASKKISVSAAIRLICQTSPLLKEFLNQDDLTVYFEIGDWGGYRKRGDEGND